MGSVEPALHGPLRFPATTGKLESHFMSSTDPLVHQILGNHTDPRRERRLRALLEEDPRCADFIRLNSRDLASKLSAVASYEDFLDLFAEVIWACLLAKGGATVHLLPSTPGQRSPDYQVRALDVEFYGECRRIRESTDVEIFGAGPITTMSYAPRVHGASYDHSASRKISAAILDKLRQFRPVSPNILLVYADAFMSMEPVYFDDAMLLFQHLDDRIPVRYGFLSREDFINHFNRVSMVAFRQAGVVNLRRPNIVYTNPAAGRPLPLTIRTWLENLNFAGTAAAL